MAKHFFQLNDGTRLCYRDEGHGPALLALAGLTRDGRDFDYLARHLKGIRLLRLDSRGRGESDWTDPASYHVLQEAHDALALLDHLGIDQAALIGTSRGGLLAMAIAHLAPERVTGVCLNDVGPVLERAGLARIGTYLGIAPAVATLEEVADRMPAARPGFHHVPEMRWAEETVRQYEQDEGCVRLPYHPALRIGFEQAMNGPLTDAWPLFDACAHVPVAVIRGEHSDVLSKATVQAMQTRRPDLITCEVADRGHAPFLDKPEALATIERWLAVCCL